MTWSYFPSMLSAYPVFQVRLIIGDTVIADQQLQDEEIALFLTMRSTVWGAAAECCRTLSSQYSRSVDNSAGDSKISYSQMAVAYSMRAQQFDAKAAQFGAGMPYVGGISIADKQNAEQDDDRVNPQFALGMFDNFLPVGQMSPSAPGATDENS